MEAVKTLSGWPHCLAPAPQSVKTDSLTPAKLVPFWALCQLNWPAPGTTWSIHSLKLSSRKIFTQQFLTGRQQGLEIIGLKTVIRNLLFLLITLCFFLFLLFSIFIIIAIWLGLPFPRQLLHSTQTRLVSFLLITGTFRGHRPFDARLNYII